MNRVSIARTSWILVFSAVALVAGYATSLAAQKAPEAAKTQRSRLPNYYAKVVTDEQRTEINAIQDEYAPQIDKLRDELEALENKRDAAVEKVLTAEQRKEVERLRAEAQARRKSGATAGTESEDSAPKSKAKAKKAA